MSSSGSKRSNRGTDSGTTASARLALDALLQGTAGDPVRRALWLDALDQRLRVCLPSHLAAHARLANVSGDRLVFLVDAPVWHAKLRMAGPQLLDAARSLGLEVTSVAIRVGTPAVPVATGQPLATPLSAEAQRALRMAREAGSGTMPEAAPATDEPSPHRRHGD